MERHDVLGVGFSIHPDLDFLELARSLIEDEADYFEVNPETLWRPVLAPVAGDTRETSGQVLERNDYWQLFSDMQAASGKPFVAHGLAFSLGSSMQEAGESVRVENWLTRLADDHAAFDFAWMSEHLGWMQSEGTQAVLPLPLPFTQEAVAAVATRLRRLADVVPIVAFENSANYFYFGDGGMSADAHAVRETEFLNAILDEAGSRLLLDLHNVHTQAQNLGFDPFAFIDRLDLARVIEIHLSGGSDSDPEWLSSGRVMRLDSHDGAVPDRVWRLLEHVLPRCTGLRGIILERLNGTFDESDLPGLTEELKRAKSLLPLAGTAESSPDPARATLPPGGGLSRLQAWLVEVPTAEDPSSRLDAAAADLPVDLCAQLQAIDRDGFALTGLLVRKLRFERLCRGDSRIEEVFERGPEEFVETYERYNHEVPATAYFPVDEARLFEEWSNR